MNEQDRFKEALNEISVPSKELDAILADAFKQEEATEIPLYKNS